MARMKSAEKVLKNTVRGIGARMMARKEGRANFRFAEIIQPPCALFASTSTQNFALTSNFQASVKFTIKFQ